jgi:tetratricopeptide (TPR) repeat protein
MFHPLMLTKVALFAQLSVKTALPLFLRNYFPQPERRESIISASCPPEIPATNQGDVKGLNSQAFSLVLQGKFREALLCHQQAVMLQPDSERTHNNLGALLACQGNHESAIASYQHALALNPGFVEAYLGMAACFLAMGRNEEAINSCKQALEIDPHHAGAHNNLGVANMGLRNVAEAVSCYAKDWRRSIPLVEFAPLASIGGVALLSLQKGPASKQLASLGTKIPVIDLGSRLDEEGAAFLDTAAVMKNLNLVITSDTALVHLAGAMSIPVWLALGFVADWRWLEQRADSPWYPTMRIFRQTEPGDWQGVFKRIKEELLRFRDKGRNTVSYRVGISPGDILDKVTILQLKADRTNDAKARALYWAELQVLRHISNGRTRHSPQIRNLLSELEAVNRAFWDAEDQVRRFERAENFGPLFVQHARSIYQLNDGRSLLKQEINLLTGSPLCEEKIYDGTQLDSHSQSEDQPSGPESQQGPQHALESGETT